MNLTISPSTLAGTLELPASKSLCHRALICAALARGTSRLFPVEPSDDILATLNALKTMGADISLQGQTCTIQGMDPFSLSSKILDCHQSGSTLRFLIPVAALSDAKQTFVGDSTLLSRPMGVYADLFLRQGLLFDQSAESIIVQGPLQPGLFTLPGNISSQFISGLLFATPLMAQPSEIAVLPPYQSRSYVSLTLQMLKTFGIDIVRLSEHGYSIPANQSYQAADVQIEADYSQLSYFAVYAALKNPLHFCNLNPASLQGDRILLTILRKAGARLSWKQNELTIQPQRPDCISVDLSDCPDLAPALFVLASFLPGKSSFVSIDRLRFKESDRIEAMRQELSRFGVEFELEDDLLLIEGHPHYEVKGPVTLQTHKDHRVAMAMSIFALLNGTEIILEDARVVDKSYPGFFEDLQKLGAKIS